jgi:hypothetical protein
VGWHLAGGAAEAYVRQANPLEQSTIFQFGRDAHNFEKLRDEVEKREVAGQQVGAVIVVLWASICGHRDVASMEQAIQKVEALGNANKFRTHRNTYWKYLSLLQPALHLWAEHSRRVSLHEPSWFSSPEDIPVFLTNAEIIADHLKEWNAAQPRPSKLLNGFIEPYDGWIPSGDGIRAIELPPAMIPTRKKPGRPAK